MQVQMVSYTLNLPEYNATQTTHSSLPALQAPSLPSAKMSFLDLVII